MCHYGEEITGGCYFIYCVGQRILLKRDELGGARTTHGRGEKCIQNYNRITLREEITWQTYA
jgi:hypothetical protein